MSLFVHTKGVAYICIYCMNSLIPIEMKDLDKHIQKQRNLIYEPLCRMFFEKFHPVVNIMPIHWLRLQ